MNSRSPTIRTRALGVLASVLAIGALAPQSNQPVNPGGNSREAALQRASTPGAQQRAIPQQAASNHTMAALFGGGYSPHRGGSVPPKVWGMSEACRRMVRKNAGIARGISAQRL